MARDRARTVQQAFARQARAFARSPLQRDPERLRRLLDVARPVPGERALDVACGPGIVVAGLRAAGLSAVGIDLTAEMIREARAASGTGGAYVRGDVARLPFRDRAFDLVICRNTFHHLGDPAAVAREMARVTRGGGRVVIEDMRAPEDPERRAYHETIERLRDVSHASTLTRDEMASMVAEAGLAIDREEPIAFTIDFDEWIDRAYPSPADRDRARVLMEASIGEDRCGLRVWREGTRLRFERRSLILRAVRRA
jgi:ubiquinone/menaquinone biosynthesis C-methylase UbiE